MAMETQAAEAAPVVESETDEDSSTDWEALSDGVEPGADDGAEAEEVVLPESEPEPAPAPKPKAPEEPATTTEPKEEPPTTPVEMPPPAKTPEQLAADSEALVKQFTEWQASEVARLTKEYAFNEDDSSRLQTEPELVLPVLAAKMQVNMTQQIVEIVQRMMPQMLNPVLKSNSREAEAESFFKSHNADLDLSNDTHRSAIQEAGKAFRKMNPKATPEQAAKGIGRIVRTALGMEDPPAAAPAASPTRRTAPHKPPIAGGRGPAPAKPMDKNAWSDLIDDD
jgi:hypothetical protein